MASVRFRLKSKSGEPVASAATLVAYPNGTRRTGQTNADGEWLVDLYRTDQPMQFLAAAPGHLPFSSKVTPGNRSVITLKLEPASDDRRALLFTSSTGYIPGMEGRLNPVHDDLGRLYVYTDNIAIDDKVQHPAPFQLNQPLQMIDVYGVETTARFLVAAPEFSLIEYTEPRQYEEVA